MALTKQKKADLLSGFEKITKESGSIVFVHAKGMTVADTMKLRDALAANDAGFKVVKKSLLKRALNSAGITGEMPVLDGEMAVAFSKDLTAPAREVYNFAKKFGDKMAVVGGVFEGRYMTQAEMVGIATIPPTPVLRGMFVNVINSPIQGLVIALNAIAEKKS